jgi:hypothetical protein
MEEADKMSAPFKLLLRLLRAFLKEEPPKGRRGRRDFRPDRRRAVIVTISSSILTVAGVRNDDPWTVFPCLAIAAVCFVWVVVMYARSAKSKTCSALAIIAFFGFLCWRGYERVVTAKDEEVFNHLIIEMGPVANNTPFQLLYTIRNPASSTIKRHQTTCLYNAIKEGNGNMLIMEKKGAMAKWIEKRPISGGGDAITDRCYTEFMSFSTPVVCVDVTIQFSYELEDSPHKQRTKPARFVINKDAGPIPFWYQESPNTVGNFCDKSANVE